MRKNIQLFLLYITMPESIFQMWFWKNYYLLIQAGNSVFGVPRFRSVFIVARVGRQRKQRNEVDDIFYHISPAESGRFTLFAEIMPTPEQDGTLIQPDHEPDQCAGPGA